MWEDARASGAREPRDGSSSSPGTSGLAQCGLLGQTQRHVGNAPMLLFLLASVRLLLGTRVRACGDKVLCIQLRHQSPPFQDVSPRREGATGLGSVAVRRASRAC